MRWRIVTINSAVLIIVGLLSFVILRVSLSEVLEDRSARRAEVERAVRAANLRLELDGLRLERWLAGRTPSEEIQGVFLGGTARARSDSARVQAKRLQEAASKAPEFANLSIPLVVFVDAEGIAIGRNDSSQMRGEDLGHAYPSIGQALETGEAGSHVWLNRRRSEQLLVSHAPVRSEAGAVVGLLVMGTPLNDERLAQVSEDTSAQALTIGAIQSADGVEVIAEGGRGAPRGVFNAMRSQDVLRRAGGALESGLAVFADDDNAYAAQPLRAYQGAKMLLVAGVRQSLVPSVSALLWPLFAVTLLGIFMVVAGAVFIGNYLARPVEQIEDGLLSIINGSTNHRFEVEHPDLGGLVFQLNSLLNVLMGVPETDEEGVTSQPPGAVYREAEDP